jgi:hypothetical protein
LWVIPADVRGRWSLASDGMPAAEVRFEQQFQQVSGTATISEHRVELTDVRLRGDRLIFTVPADAARGALRYAGRVAGDSAGGTLSVDGNAAPRAWRAMRHRAD